MKKCIGAALLVMLLLTGCASLLEREYSTVEPHSGKFWESEAAGTLRAENYQDIVNDLLLLIGQHTERATLRLYSLENDLSVAEMLDRATYEIRQETAMGAYAVEYITSASQAQRGYYEISVQISYRRTAAQLQSVVNATSTEALYRLLGDAVEQGDQELVVRIGYWTPESRLQAEEIARRVREEQEMTEAPPWLVFYYPADGEVGLLEFLLAPSENELLAAAPENKVPHDPENTEEGADTVPEDIGEGGDTEPVNENGLPEAASLAPSEETEKISGNMEETA